MLVSILGMKAMGISHPHENEVTALLTSLTGGEALLSGL